MLAVAFWSLTSALHTLVDNTAVRIVIAKFQYLGIAPIGVLWLLFTSDYARAAWPADRVLRWGVWLIPAATLILAATNERHHIYWSAITEVSTPHGLRVVYTGGPWYWINAGYSYLLIAAGTLTLVRGLRRFPPPYRRQMLLIIAGALVPWIGNLIYLTRLVPATGLDITPLAFTVSGACFTLGLYRYRLFGLARWRATW